MLGEASRKYRDELARALRDAPKTQRPEMLNQARETPAYWDARTEKIDDQADEEVLTEGLGGVLIKHKLLYYGSRRQGLHAFRQAEETTVGSGVYCTSQAKDAIGYARRRARSQVGTQPTLYEVAINNMKMLDLRNEQMVKDVLVGYKEVLQAKKHEPGISWSYETVLQHAIDAINLGNVGIGNLREVTFGTGKLFSEYVKSLGYDGLIALEGGEGDDIGNHDTYLIFDPERIKIRQEQQIET
jgi:hypothetical protein